MADEVEQVRTSEPDAAPSRQAGPRRTRVLVVGLLLAVAVGAAGIALVDRERGADAPAICEPGVDHLVIGASSFQRDDELFQGFSSLALLRSDESSSRWLNEPRQVVTAATFSPGGDRIAVRWADGEDESGGPESASIWVIDLADGDARPLTLGPSDAAPAWSPDGSTIAFQHRSRSGGGTLSLVPADGGELRDVVDLGPDPSTRVAHLWRSDDELVLLRAAWDPEETAISLAALDGTETPVATLDGTLDDALLAPTGDELIVQRRTPDTALRTRLAVDLATGSTRPIDGPLGQLAASPDGDRAYLIDDDGELHRASYDGEEVAIAESLPLDLDLEARGYGLAVGRCAEIDPLATPKVDAPLIGTDWRLGPKRLAVLPGQATEGCEAPDCTPIVLVATDDVPDPSGPVDPCVVATASLRGGAVDLDGLTPSNDEDCWTGWTEAPPVSLEVDGSVLRVGFASPRSEWITTRSYGAWLPDGPSGPPSAEVPTEDDVARFEATTTTTAPPRAIECGVLEGFGRDLAASSVELADRPSSSPAALAGGSTVVVRGSLIGGGLASVEGPEIDAAVLYELRVDEVLAGAAADVEPGEEVEVLVPFRFDREDLPGARPLPPPLGDFAGPDDILRGGAIPAVAFLTTEGGAWPGDLLVAGPAGLAVGCDGRPATGLVGTGPAWDGLDLDALATAVRD